MTIADCRAHGHGTPDADGVCPFCAQVIAQRCVQCGDRLYFGDRAKNDGLCAPCRIRLSITPLPPRRGPGCGT